ncbi:MAG: hypothetical protein ABW189_08515 [Rickettsiales bacterium]
MTDEELAVLEAGLFGGFIPKKRTEPEPYTQKMIPSFSYGVAESFEENDFAALEADILKNFDFSGMDFTSATPEPTPEPVVPPPEEDDDVVVAVSTTVLSPSPKALKKTEGNAAPPTPSQT